MHLLEDLLNLRIFAFEKNTFVDDPIRFNVSGHQLAALTIEKARTLDG
jgi:hypothetical protein